jgi:hypothetical protein
MTLDCPEQNCSNFGDNYDDSQKKTVPNSLSEEATSHGSGPDLEVDCHAKKFQFSHGSGLDFEVDCHAKKFQFSNQMTYPVSL